MGWYALVGTSHLASQSLQRIRKAFLEFQPDAVAVELDANRLAALRNRAKPSYSPRLIREIGMRGYLFAVIGGFFQRRLGGIVDVTPGSDMLLGVRLAEKHGKRSLLIDQDIRVTLRRLNSSMGWPEFKQFAKDLWRGLSGKERVSFNLNEVPQEESVKALISEFGNRYPRPFKVLVTERNHRMVAALRRFHEQFPEERVLVVVGAGHVAGLRELLEREE